MPKKKTTPPKSYPRGFPSKDAILAFIEDSSAPVGKREIARAFNIKGDDKRILKALLKEMKSEGLLERHAGRAVATIGRLPEVTVLEVRGRDQDGETLCTPANWDKEKGRPPTIYLAPDKRRGMVPTEGERVLARLSRTDEDEVYEARIIRRLGRTGPKEVLGIYEPGPKGKKGRLKPVDKKAKHDFALDPADSEGAEPGELVLCQLLPGHKRMGLQDVKVVERLGSLDNHRALSLIAIHDQGLPTVFPEAAEVEAESAGPVKLAGKRVDLRKVPLVTIDGADARDFDDAVFAEPDDTPNNKGGWHALVAIADVAHYVRYLSALDKEAYKRGNSTYFPDRVVPMLPEALSNGWCSLVPKEDRGCLAVHLWISPEGKLLKHRFERGLMRSAARLTYEQVQAARDGRPDDTTGPLMEQVIEPLYGVFQSLLTGRRNRGVMELDLPERQVILDDKGQVKEIKPRQRLDAHRLIEELMITANVAAATELEKRNRPCMYRVHEEPDLSDMGELNEVLKGIGLKLGEGGRITQRSFARLLDAAAKTPYLQMVSELVLRSQMRAFYGPENYGHFGLALQRYAHFTSPIRRYSDLIVHRWLITALKLGDDGYETGAETRMEEWGEHISFTERRSIAAERDAIDRMTAAFLADRVGEIFQGRINGVTRFGLFVTLLESGADLLVPFSGLPSDHYRHDEKHHRLVGSRSGRVFTLADQVSVRLVESDGLTGSSVGELVEGEESRSDTTESSQTRSEKAWDPLKKREKSSRSRASSKKGKRPRAGAAKPKNTKKNNAKSKR